MPDTNTSNSRIAIRQARQMKGMVQADLARLVGVNQALISFIETGMANVPIKDRPRYAWALGVSVDQIQWGGD